MRPKYKLLSVFAAGVLVCGAWLYHATTGSDAAGVEVQSSTKSTAAPTLSDGHDVHRTDPRAEEPSIKRDPRVSFSDELRSIANGRHGRIPAAEARKDVLLALSRTGPSSEPWTRTAPQVYSSLSDEVNKLSATTDLKITRVECYSAGCIGTLSYSDDADPMMLSHSIAKSQAAQSWPGAKMSTPAGTSGSGRQESDFILLRPGA
jgi:hypothetical protein